MKKLLKSLLPTLLIVVAMFIWVGNNIDYRALADNEYQRLWVHAPTIVQQGESFDVSVQAWDYCERLAINYQNTIVLADYIYNSSTRELELANNSLITPYQFTTSGWSQGFIPGNYFPNGDNGNHKFKNIKLLAPGIHYIKVMDNQGNSIFSNPIIVFKDQPEYRVYWGDIHGHSAMSEGSGLPEESYTYARDVALLDFAALTDHDFIFEIADPYNINHYYKVAERYNLPGSFVTLLAYEWTPTSLKYGSRWHLNVYFKNNSDLIFLSMLDYTDPDALWAKLREWKQDNPLNDVITFPHHTASHNYYDWSYYDPEFMPLVEVYSCHGSSEMSLEDGNPRPIELTVFGEMEEPGYHIKDALQMGYRLGMMCSSDTHDGRLGHSLLHTDYNMPSMYPLSPLDYFRSTLKMEGSLTAMMIEDLSRESIFMGLKNRTCYGTTHVNRMFLNFSINGYPVGGNYRSELDTLNISTINTISAFAAADYACNISSIEILRNSEVFCVLNSTGLYNTTHKILTRNGLGPIENLTITPANFNFTLTGTEYTDGFMEDGEYYIHSNANKPLEGFSTESPPSTEGIDYYYMRVIQETPHGSTDIGWIGPIWVG